MARTWHYVKQNWVAILGLLFLTFCAIQFVRWVYGPSWFADLEEHSRKAVKPEALQNWATNLIAMCPLDTASTFTTRDLGTNFPGELRKLSPHEPTVSVYHLPGPEATSFVRVTWSAGAVLGQRGLHIGPPSFAGEEHVSMWQSNVYFFQEVRVSYIHLVLDA